MIVASCHLSCISTARKKDSVAGFSLHGSRVEAVSAAIGMPTLALVRAESSYMCVVVVVPTLKRVGTTRRDRVFRSGTVYELLSGMGVMTCIRLNGCSPACVSEACALQNSPCNLPSAPSGPCPPFCQGARGVLGLEGLKPLLWDLWDPMCCRSRIAIGYSA